MNKSRISGVQRELKIERGLDLLDIYRETRESPQRPVEVRVLFDLIEYMSKREPFRAAWEAAGDDVRAMVLSDVMMIVGHRVQESFGELARVDGSELKPWRFALDEIAGA